MTDAIPKLTVGEEGADVATPPSPSPFPSANPSLLKLRLLECIRGGDTAKLTGLLAQIDSEPANEALAKLHAEVLHYAVQVGALATVKAIVDEKLVPDVNYQDKDGNTALHLAAMSGRNDVIEYLMSLAEVNDTLLNSQNKQPIECTSNMEVVQLMNDLRVRYVEVESSKLLRAFQQRDKAGLEAVLNNPRAKELLDLNGPDPVTGDTVLLEFVKKDDVPMVKFILSHGGDPFKRSTSGRLPMDCCESQAMRRVIKSACDQQTVIDSSAERPSVGPPTFKGFLKKWTNFAGGYKLRWFVLAADGTLSYYRSPNEIDNACRGMVHLTHALVRMDSSEKCKFELIVHNQSGGTPIRWHLRANHQIESSRWVWMLQNSIQYSRDKVKAERRNNTGKSLVPPHRHSRQLSSAEQARQRVQASGAAAIPAAAVPAPHEAGNSNSSLSLGKPGKPGRPAHLRSASSASLVSTASHSSLVSVKNGAKKLVKKPMRRLSQLAQKKRSGLRNSSHGSPPDSIASYDFGETGGQSTVNEVESGSVESEEEDEDEDEMYRQMVLHKQKPYNEKLVVLRNQIGIEMKSFREFLQGVTADEGVDKTQLVGVATRILNNLEGLYSKEGDILKERDDKLDKLIERQSEVSNIWESSIRQLELEIQDREKKICDLEDTIKLVRRSLRASVIVPAAEPTTATTVESSPSKVPVSRERASISSVNNPQLTKFLTEDTVSDDEFFDAEEEEEEELESKQVEEEIVGGEDEEDEEETEVVKKVPATEEVSKSIDTDGETLTATTPDGVAEDSEETNLLKEDDTTPVEPAELSPTEPFEPTIEDGKYIVDSLPLVTPVQIERYKKMLADESFKGYEDEIRTTLKKEDDRPKVSLWGVLKSLIGRDMTRMTLPVAFNEPTSLLQRNIEIMEYAPLLDKAAQQDYSPLRLAYVAGFAASEYASTAGRIAKPFNPLLGETYEYSRPDLGYRVFCEQVSHHPPVSAVVAESPYFAYYGGSNVKTKFYGRSFDIKHLGTWFCELYPSAAEDQKEVYSWKKVNNSVVGIIVGRPTIDNYGEMVITNHMTGDYMDFHFKERGWRASTACEVKGEIYTKDGKLVYNVGGHWNTKIYAKSATDPNAQKFVIFAASKRQEMLFHLTNFAAGLNAPQPHLMPMLACTDTRLRPDQRAMENGQYDLAAEEKNNVEEKQRAARRVQEASGKPYEPVFFVKDKHPVTGDEYWRFTEEYWLKRRDGKLKDYKDIF